MSDPIRVLITDNSLEFAALLKERLEFYPGIKVVVIAHNAAQTLRLLSETEVHVLLLDIVMPGTDGLELLRILADSGSKPIVFMISALGTDTIIKQAMSLGASGFFVKPIDCDRLAAAMGAAVRKQESGA